MRSPTLVTLSLSALSLVTVISAIPHGHRPHHDPGQNGDVVIVITKYVDPARPESTQPPTFQNVDLVDNDHVQKEDISSGDQVEPPDLHAATKFQTKKTTGNTDEHTTPTRLQNEDEEEFRQDQGPVPIPSSSASASPDVSRFTEGKSTLDTSEGNAAGDCASLGPSPDVSSAPISKVAEWYTSYHRCNHSSTLPAKWSTSLASAAQNCATSCSGSMRGGGVHCANMVNGGAQNVYFPSKTLSPGKKITSSIQIWYYGMLCGPKSGPDCHIDPEDNWNTLFTNDNQLTPAGKANDKANHPSDMLTRSRTGVGCGISECPADGGFARVVCNYGPGGEAGAGEGLGVPLGEPGIPDGVEGVLKTGTTLGGKGGTEEGEGEGEGEEE